MLSHWGQRVCFSKCSSYFQKTSRCCNSAPWPVCPLAAQCLWVQSSAESDTAPPSSLGCGGSWWWAPSQQDHSWRGWKTAWPAEHDFLSKIDVRLSKCTLDIGVLGQ